MSAPKGSKNAMKGDEPASSFLHIRCTQADKSAWVKSALRRRKNLSIWVIEELNRIVDEDRIVDY